MSNPVYTPTIPLHSITLIDARLMCCLHVVMLFMLGSTLGLSIFAVICQLSTADSKIRTFHDSNTAAHEYAHKMHVPHLQGFGFKSATLNMW